MHLSNVTLAFPLFPPLPLALPLPLAAALYGVYRFLEESNLFSPTLRTELRSPPAPVGRHTSVQASVDDLAYFCTSARGEQGGVRCESWNEE